MDWYDKVKRFLGLPGRQDSPTFDSHPRNFPEPPFRDEEFNPHSYTRSYNVFTDPLEMHKFFEQQMSEMLKNFGFNDFGDGYSHQFNSPFFGDSEDRYGWPQLGQDLNEEQQESDDLRDQFLKPGYGKAQSLPEEKKDKDLDGKLDVKDWDSVFRGESSVTPYQREVAPKKHFFGKSVTSKTIRNSDGSLETHHTVRDSEGNEETRITKKIGDKEYSIIKRKDKDGKEETIENLVNLDEKEKDAFFSEQKMPQLDQGRRWPFFEHFFK